MRHAAVLVELEGKHKNIPLDEDEVLILAKLLHLFKLTLKIVSRLI